MYFRCKKQKLMKIENMQLVRMYFLTFQMYKL